MPAPDTGSSPTPEPPAQKQKTPVFWNAKKRLLRFGDWSISAMRAISRALQRVVSAGKGRITAVRAWLYRRPADKKGEKFGLSGLEASLTVILFAAQVAIPMMGVQQNFWGAAVCWCLILLLLIRIVWRWENTKRFTNLAKSTSSAAIVAVTLYVIWGPMTKTFYLTERPSFVFLVPTGELVNCERRAFVVKHIGAKILTNIDITLLDDATNRGDVTKYPEIAPGAPDPMAPKFIWLAPSHSWFEDYTITATAGDTRIRQRLALRTGQGRLQLASEVSINGRPPIFSCRDPFVPSSVTVALDAKQTCEQAMSVSKETKDMMGLATLNYQTPDRKYNVNILRTLSASPGTEGKPENRHMWEFQKMWMANDIFRWRGASVLLMASGSGVDTWKYAEELRDVFRLAKWNVEGPKLLPASYDGLLDIQVSRDDAITFRPELQAIMDALTRAGLKHHTRPFRDPDIESNQIVLFVGSRSPDSVDPDDCISVPIKRDKMKEKPCAAVAQTTKICPLPPPNESQIF